MEENKIPIYNLYRSGEYIDTTPFLFEAEEWCNESWRNSYETEERILNTKENI